MNIVKIPPSPVNHNTTTPNKWVRAAALALFGTGIIGNGAATHLINQSHQENITQLNQQNESLMKALEE